MSAKHLQRYVSEFAGRHNIRELDTIDQMADVAWPLIGRRLMYRDLIAETERVGGGGLEIGPESENDGSRERKLARSEPRV